jgi:hypothetical protein
MEKSIIESFRSKRFLCREDRQAATKLLAGLIFVALPDGELA